MNEVDSVKIVCENCGTPYISLQSEECLDDTGEEVVYLQSICDCDETKFIYDLINKAGKVYIKHCWNCPAKIDSRLCKRDPNPDNGYICKRCGESLKNFKKRYY